MVHRVQFTDLNEPGSDALHDLATSLETASPVSLPLEQVAGVQCVRAELEQAAKLTWRSRGPEGELLHERGALGVDERFELGIKLGELGVMLDRVQ
jgi:hypothetical protein